MKKDQKGTRDNSMNNLLTLLMSTVNFIVITIILAFGYLILEDHIHDFLNKKKYSPEELELIARKANARQNAEEEEANWDKVVNGIHIRTGLYDDPDLQIIIASCTSCHSAKLVTQNKATREGWKGMIKWMQATQGLPDLGKYEPTILDYLAKYYAPSNTGRRKNLDVASIEWFVLNLDDTPQ